MDTKKTPLKYVQLRNSSITDEGMKILLRHNLVSLSLWYCNEITTQLWPHVLEHGKQLRCLELGKYVDLLKYPEPSDKTPIEPAFQLDLPHLQRLVLNGVDLQSATQFTHLIHLKHLDLTLCSLRDFDLGVLSHLPNLQTLILFNVWPLEEEIPKLCKLTGLRTLDLSLNRPGANGTYSSPNQLLAKLVESLPYLTHLDISGTNLAGNGIAQFAKGGETGGNVRGSDIPGLISRVNNPLQFLGLYGAAHSACRRYDIPALTVN